jgi:glutamine synthetase
MQAAILAAGMDGIRNGRDPGKRLDINMYTHGHTVKNAKKLPLNLLDALRSFEKSSMLRASLGTDFVDAYRKLKMEEWNEYSRHLSLWERQSTLDC